MNTKAIKIIRGYCGGYDLIQAEPTLQLYYKSLLKVYDKLDPDKKRLFLEYASKVKIEKNVDTQKFGEKTDQETFEVEIKGVKKRVTLEQFKNLLTNKK